MLEITFKCVPLVFITYQNLAWVTARCRQATTIGVIIYNWDFKTNFMTGISYYRKQESCSPVHYCVFPNVSFLYYQQSLTIGGRLKGPYRWQHMCIDDVATGPWEKEGHVWYDLMYPSTRALLCPFKTTGNSKVVRMYIHLYSKLCVFHGVYAKYMWKHRYSVDNITQGFHI